MNGILGTEDEGGMPLIILAKVEAKCDFSLDTSNGFSL